MTSIKVRNRSELFPDPPQIRRLTNGTLTIKFPTEIPTAATCYPHLWVYTDLYEATYQPHVRCNRCQTPRLLSLLNMDFERSRICVVVSRTDFYLITLAVFPQVMLGRLWTFDNPREVPIYHRGSWRLRTDTRKMISANERARNKRIGAWNFRRKLVTHHAIRTCMLDKPLDRQLSLIDQYSK